MVLVTSHRRAALAGASALLLVVVGCGEATGPTIEPTGSPIPTGQATGQPTGQPTSGPTDAPTASQPSGDFTPGSVPYRVVNLAAEPVDVYVRTQGLVEAWLVEEGLATGEVLDYVSPPDPGTLVITAAGAGDPTCVGTCPDFLASIGNTSGFSSQSTVVIHPDGVTEYWEQPDPADVGQSANALRPADPASAMIFAIGRAVVGADFGLRVAFEGEAGCAVDIDESNLLVGGTSVLAYTFDDEVAVTVHDPADTTCAEEPLAGPFAVEGDAGSRTLLLLYGPVEQMEALALPIP